MLGVLWPHAVGQQQLWAADGGTKEKFTEPSTLHALWGSSGLLPNKALPSAPSRGEEDTQGSVPGSPGRRSSWESCAAQG